MPTKVHLPLQAERDFKIIDCCTFFNELNLLRLRIKILEDHVDHFVIVEARQTFTGNPKQCLLNQECAPDIIGHPKVIAKTISLPRDISAWQREDVQRESIHEAVLQLSANKKDIILLSDVDEIPSPAAIQEASVHLQQSEGKDLIIFEQRLFYFRFNYELIYSKKLPWLGTTAMNIIHITSMKCMRTTGRNLRGRKHRRYFDQQIIRRQISKGGWHFSYLGGDDLLREKIQSFSHQEAEVQAAKFSNTSVLISKRASLFPHESSHEIWATVPLEDLGLPQFILTELRQSSLISESPCTIASEIIDELTEKSHLARFKIGNLEIGLRKCLRPKSIT